MRIPGATGLRSIARHGPGQAIRVLLELPEETKKEILGMGEAADGPLEKVLPWAVSALVLYVGYNMVIR
jgi:hypothetical protein